MKILVVDDSRTMRNLIINSLEKIGVTTAEIIEATNGADAVKSAFSENLVLILMDWNMPTLNGLDAVKAIRAGGKHTPIIMVTTEREKPNVLQAIQAGADGFILKPFKERIFLEKIRSILRMS
jgi:two-component system, chemotaxis family, chemotaxis protein CheY